MKVEEHRSLWSAIQQFPLNDPDAEITFSRKLSAKQNWSPSYTEQVIEEYRKFLFLCCISPNGASPSQAVDEAWHLHLTYTKSYWIDLCKNTLNKDIHHHPSGGGDVEDHRHRDWYKETLGLYQSVFESPPPNDIWPPPREYEFHLPAPAWVIRKEVLALIVILLTLPLIVSAYLYSVLSPFSLKGPQFLVFFPLLAISCIICYIILQYEKGRTLKELVASNFPTDASAFQIAQFLYGKHRAIQTGIVDLLRRNLIVLTPDKRFMVFKKRYTEQDNEKNPLIMGIINDQYDCVNYDAIVSDWYKEEAATHPALQRLYLLAYHQEPYLKKHHVLLIPFVVGVARFMQGAARGNPVVFLFFEMFALLAVSYIVSMIFSWKQMVLDKAKELATDNQIVGTLYDDTVVSDFALKGDRAIIWFAEGALLASIFASYPVLDHLRKFQTNFACSSCSSGGCSGGGGGCSGGGGCGGGCGGCGGD
jgi:uncharacterized protein (TIGR04222 family)